jgi:glycosyltransferase involved in cell wall biosynthesis
MISPEKPLQVCIDARMVTGVAGGVEQVVVGLAAGLSALEGDEQYSYLVLPGAHEWIGPYVGNGRLLVTGSARGAVKSALRSVGPARWAWHHLTPALGSRTVRVPRSDGTIERAGIEVMHFTFQPGFLTDVPSIYQPWDLQHLHLPGFFTPRERLGREVIFRALCDQARVVATPSMWVKRDVETHLGVPPDKVAVVPAAPVLTAYASPTGDEVKATAHRLDLRSDFLFYPAQTWPHKNHLRLVEAISLLRDGGLEIPIVCSGFLNRHYYREIAPAIERHGLADLIRFVGFVSPIELQSLYRLCRGVVLPTLFEGWGMPLIEAFVAGRPVASASVTSLPEQAGDAALLFDPTSTDEIARAMEALWTDSSLRTKLVTLGRTRAEGMTWDRVARIYRAYYRRIADRPLSAEDRELMSPGWALATAGGSST